MNRSSWLVFVAALIIAFRVQADAPPPHYTLQSGTVRDNGTQLTWQQAPDATKRSWSDAASYCTQLQLAGTGWRVPTLKELLTLVDPARTTDPVIDATAFPSTPKDTFWSSNPFAADTNYAWTVDFRFGNSAKDHAKSAGAYVRCVR